MRVENLNFVKMEHKVKKSILVFAVLSFVCVTILSSCGELSEEEAAALSSLLSDLELDDCYETEDEGYVAENDTETDETSETNQLEECKAALIAAYDIDESGSVDSDAEIEALNEDVQERQATKLEVWEAQGLTESEGRALGKKKRKFLRSAAKAGCLEDFDADSNGALSPTELKSCHDARKTEREEIRLDIRCQNDSAGECGPVSKDKIKALFKAKISERDELLKEIDPDGNLDPDTARENASSFEERRKEDAQSREGRVEENKTKAAAGQVKRKERGQP